MIFSALLFFKLLIHPFHVSVTEVKYKEEKKVLQISTRIFLDDLEVAISNYSKIRNLDIKENWNVVNNYLGSYLLENLKLYDQKGSMEMRYVGAEIEKDVVWCYAEVEKVKKLKKIIIRNTLLTETFQNQENIVHFRAYDKVKSARLYLDANKEVFDWEHHR